MIQSRGYQKADCPQSGPCAVGQEEGKGMTTAALKRLVCRLPEGSERYRHAVELSLRYDRWADRFDRYTKRYERIGRNSKRKESK